MWFKNKIVSHFGDSFVQSLILLTRIEDELGKCFTQSAEWKEQFVEERGRKDIVGMLFLSLLLLWININHLTQLINYFTQPFYK